MYILFFDIGNTNTKVGISNGEDMLASYVLPTNDRHTIDEFGFTLLQILQHAAISPDELIGGLASSVVPGMSLIVRKACKRFLNLSLLFAPEDVPVPLENRYSRPHEVGADRLVGAYASRRLFPEAGSLVCIDYGTATTFDCVEGDAYLGGLICPGVLSSMSSLASGTAKLPRISLEVEESLPVPGRSTSTSLNHGFVFGFAAMTEGLTAQLAKGLTGPVKVVGTGGFATSIAKVAACFDCVRPDLLLDGLRLLYKEQMK